METSYSMADELKHVLSYYKEEKHKVRLDLKLEVIVKS